ncbi:hypothetical protein [Natronolimnobius baerhuensis]|uniref:Uncharacterized protein n=1 Tax=Natronolimnobius baerhuensis TaxID=253108 RepID=A0A202E5U9_9EURY|nr:hypothetical protein [Natronolimnobius baerhuensis]OVE83663.1 hypothetical protein B2G88_14630 [Natronolimnobius baerhuensis]
MSSSASGAGPHAADATDLSDTTVHRAVAGYVGVVVAALALTAAVAANTSALVLLGATLAGFVAGAAAGGVASSRVPTLPIHIGRTRYRRGAVVGLAAPFVAITFAAIFGSVGSQTGLAAIASAFGIVLAGQWLSSVARTRAVAATVSSKALATARWQPPRSPALDWLLLGLWPLVAAMNAYVGDWFSAFIWAGLGLLWATSGLIEGRFRLGDTGVDPEIRIYEAGLVKQRPYSATLVSWDDVDHVRLRDGELVLERGFFDVRFDQGTLEDPKDVLSVIEGQLSRDVRVV